MNHEPSVVAKRLQGYFQYTNLENYEPTEPETKSLSKKEPSLLENLWVSCLTQIALSLTKAALKATRAANQIKKKYD